MNRMIQTLALAGALVLTGGACATAGDPAPEPQPITPVLAAPGAEVWVAVPDRGYYLSSRTPGGAAILARPNMVRSLTFATEAEARAAGFVPFDPNQSDGISRTVFVATVGSGHYISTGCVQGFALVAAPGTSARRVVFQTEAEARAAGYAPSPGAANCPRATSSPATAASPAPATGGPVHVRGYYRRDGTYVRPHSRSRPRRRN